MTRYIDLLSDGDEYLWERNVRWFHNEEEVLNDTQRDAILKYIEEEFYDLLRIPTNEQDFAECEKE